MNTTVNTWRPKSESAPGPLERRDEKTEQRETGGYAVPESVLPISYEKLRKATSDLR
jgi:hypothetical protein